jgi:hypothetical protein
MTATRAPARKAPAVTPCALCAPPTPAASPLGLCAGHLQAAADELVRLTPRQSPGDRSPSSVPFSALCRRCGSWRHPTARCDA